MISDPRGTRDTYHCQALVWAVKRGNIVVVFFLNCLKPKVFSIGYFYILLKSHLLCRTFGYFSKFEIGVQPFLCGTDPNLVVLLYLTLSKLFLSRAIVCETSICGGDIGVSYAQNIKVITTSNG